MKSKTYNKLILAPAISIFLIIVGTNLIVDPYQIIHEQLTKNTYYFNKPRICNAGIINSERFDGMILGTSMTQNFKPSEMERLFNLNKVVKLSLEGARPIEMNITAKRALLKQDIKIALIGIYDYKFIGKYDSEVDDEAPEFPFKLYDQSFLNDFKFYFDIEMFESSIELVKKSKKLYQNQDELQFWGDRKSYGYEHIKKKFLNKSRNKRYDEYKLDWMVNRYKKYIHELAFKNPNTHFLLFIPPVSTLKYAIMSKESPEAFNSVISFYKEIVNLNSGLKNVEVFFFGNHSLIVDDFKNYCDISHYSDKINTDILKLIATKKFTVSANNIDEVLLRFQERVNSFQIPKDFIHK